MIELCMIFIEIGMTAFIIIFMLKENKHKYVEKDTFHHIYDNLFGLTIWNDNKMIGSFKSADCISFWESGKKTTAYHIHYGVHGLTVWNNGKMVDSFESADFISFWK